MKTFFSIKKKKKKKYPFNSILFILRTLTLRFCEKICEMHDRTESFVKESLTDVLIKCHYAVMSLDLNAKAQARVTRLSFLDIHVSLWKRIIALVIITNHLQLIFWVHLFNLNCRESFSIVKIQSRLTVAYNQRVIVQVYVALMFVFVFVFF